MFKINFNLHTSTLGKLIPIILFLVGLNLSAQQKADYLIVENPSKLIMYNRYQQNLSQSDENLIFPFVPMKITERNGLLPDGTRTYMKVSINEIPFYIITDEEYPINIDKAGDYFFADNALVLNDTVKVISDAGIKGSNLTDHSAELIDNETLINRKFLFKDNFYCTVINNPKTVFTFQIDELKNKTEPFAKNKNLISSNRITGDIVEAVKRRISKFNTKLEDIFNLLNAEYKKSNKTPTWRVEANEDSITIVPSDKVLLNYFNESLQYLKDELTTALIRTRLQLYTEDSTMVIK